MKYNRTATISHASERNMHMTALTSRHRRLKQRRGGKFTSHVFPDGAAQVRTAPGLLPKLGSLR